VESLRGNATGTFVVFEHLLSFLFLFHFPYLYPKN
jgi:hypothetical protein